MHNFCTLFDMGYLPFGIAMYNSLKRHCGSFHLYIFAFDDACYEYLVSERMDYVSVISLKDFEDHDLLSIKDNRTKGEYCWTCTPFTILYVLKKYMVDSCTYIDSDVFFFSDPSILIDEMQDKSVLITDHWYTQAYDQTETSGKYCVQFITFKNNVDGLNVLSWWSRRCIEWCYARFEDGKFGDQKYLDDWPERFGSDVICELQNRGGGLAPWNIQQYSVISNFLCANNYIVFNNSKYNAVFFHFHNVKCTEKYNILFITSFYNISKVVFKAFYAPYLTILKKIIYQVHNEKNKIIFSERKKLYRMKMYIYLFICKIWLSLQYK